MVRCASCQASVDGNDKFCRECGVRLHDAPDILGSLPSDTSVLPAWPSFAIGERKLLTILFADLKNSTQFIGSDDPEDALRRLSPVLDLMTDAVHQYGGVISEVLGDGVMAVFGTPRPLEDHAARACLAALAIQERIARLDAPAMQVRVGIHTGEVVVKAINATLTQKLGVIGSVVHLASRLEQMSEPGAVYVTEATWRQARQYVEGREVGERSARGVPDPVQVFQVTGSRNAPTSNIFRSRSRLPRFFGRDEPMRLLDEALRSAERNEAPVVVLVGEAGIGKSRLAFEFLERCRRQDVAVIETRATPYAEATPLEPVRDLLRDYFRIRSQKDAAAACELVQERFQQLDVQSETRSVVLELLGLARPAPGMDASLRKVLLTDFIRLILQRGADGRASVVLVEDLHWLDRATEELLATVLDAVHGTRTMVLLTRRPGSQPAWLDEAKVRSLAIEPLEETVVDAIISEALQDGGMKGEVRHELADRARGNPFFIEELISAVREHGDASRIAALPPTIHGLLAARIDELERIPRHLLQIASVIGRECPVDLIGDVADIAAPEFEAALNHLRRKELIYELPQVEKRRVLMFRHPLIQEVTYRSLLSERKTALHGATAQAISRRFKTELDGHAAVLGYHLEQAGDTLAAAQALSRAASWIGVSDPGHALTTWKRVQALLSLQPDRGDLDLLRMMACGNILNLGWRDGATATDLRPYAEEASKLAVAGKNLRANALIHAGYGRLLAATGSADEYVTRIREAQTLGEPSNDPSLRVILNAILCHALRLSGWLRQALEVNETALDHCHEVQALDRTMLGFDVEHWLLGMRGQMLVATGQGGHARAALDELVGRAPDRGDATLHLIPSLALVEHAWSIGDADLAMCHARRASGIAETSGHAYLRVFAEWSRGLAHVTHGDAAGAVEILNEVLAFARKRKVGLENEARIVADLAFALLMLGKDVQAAGIAQDAIAIAQKRSARVPEYYARLVRLRALDTTNDPIDRHDESARLDALRIDTGAALFELRSELQAFTVAT